MAAGTLARLADRGVRTAVVCATRGQAGSAGTPPLASREELPALREAELRAACAILGVAAVTVLDERDRALGEADPDAMRPRPSSRRSAASAPPWCSPSTPTG
jgi:LmbE family N-acetylglucosaminyl deacetylase